MNKSILDKQFNVKQICLLVERGKTIEILTWIYNRSYYSKDGGIIYPTYRDMIMKKQGHIDWILENAPGFFSDEETRIIISEIDRIKKNIVTFNYGVNDVPA
ncbi:MAG: hypothetical protein GTN76_00385 [Candidatus Aenigmarchaeota archaeon]|nr:hypothetical protein [Candidatus Aenigmarchaeota archaeon]